MTAGWALFLQTIQIIRKEECNPGKDKAEFKLKIIKGDKNDIL